MNEDQKVWQADAKRAFEWISEVYEHSQALLDDAQAYLEEQGWSVQCGNSLGGIAMSMSDLAEWPFVYFKCLGAVPPNTGEDGPGVAAILGIVFHDTRRSGPMCVAGTVAWRDTNANCDHWVLLSAVGGDCPRWAEGAYQVGPGPLHISKPTARAAKIRPGVGDVVWFQQPLASIESAERLREIVGAAVALVGGDEAPARALATTDLNG